MSRNQKGKYEKGGKKKIHDARYIAYCKRGESAAVYIMRDIVDSIDTSDKWIDIIKMQQRVNSNIKNDFMVFYAELFPRITEPDYSKAYSDEERKYITWLTAMNDIEFQRMNGFKGPVYKVYPIIDKDSIEYAYTKKEVCLVYSENWDKWLECDENAIPKDRVWKKEIREIKSINKFTYKIREIERIR